MEDVQVLPVKSVKELLSWDGPSKNLLPYLTAIPACLKRKYDESEYKTLVCHDMKGGYLEDR